MVPFYELARQFRAVFFDSYGVLRDASGVIPGGPQAITRLRDEGVRVRVLTNDASRARGQQLKKFRALGYDNIRSDEIITSGMMARIHLQEKVSGGRVAYLGTEAAGAYVLDARCEPVAVSELTPEDFKSVDALAFLDDEGFEWRAALNICLNLLRERNIPVLMANTDRLYPAHGNQVAIGAGGIARMLEDVLGRRFLRFGKPDSQMFNFAFEDLNLQDSLAKSEILMVGDTLGTDILGGNKFGIRTCLPLSGNTSANDYKSEIRRAGIVPDYVVERIGE